MAALMASSGVIFILIQAVATTKFIFPEGEVHRIGRTGRAGNGGISISFCSKDEEPYWKDIQKLIKVNVKIMKDHPFPWKDEVPDPDAKPDLRNKKKPEGKENNSRKSEASKKNKKRWY